jgi:hypothetical protein
MNAFFFGNAERDLLWRTVGKTLPPRVDSVAGIG